MDGSWVSGAKVAGVLITNADNRTGKAYLAKTLHIKNYGCQMNVYDAVRMSDVLAPLGYRNVESPHDADLVILNTCHIREKAAEKVYSELGRLRALKQDRAEGKSPMMIGVAGCVAQAEGADITTIEGIAVGDELHPMQQAFHENHGLQCGFCTPGMIMSAIELVEHNKNLSEQDIREGLEGNICRCTGYHNIVKSVQDAAQKMGG